MLRKSVCEGFHSSRGEGACGIMNDCYEKAAVRRAYMLCKFVYEGSHSSQGEGVWAS